MDVRVPGHTREPISEHLEILREYARRVILDGDSLSPAEEAHKEAIFQRIAELGGSFRMTEREMVSLMLRGVFVDAPPCWCSTCRAMFLDQNE
jgi:hypothetical protein